jgi:hypothetical protein
MKAYSQEMGPNISAKPADPELKKYLPSILHGVTFPKPVKSKLKAMRSKNFTYFQLKRINDKNIL